MEEKKKERRYLCDTIEVMLHKIKLKYILIIGIVVISIFTIMLTDNPIYALFGMKPLTVESEKERKEIYRQLHKIANTTIKRGEEIDIKLIPKNVEYSINSEGENLLYKYSLNGTNKNIFFMKVTLSKDFKIIEENCNLESENKSSFMLRVGLYVILVNSSFSVAWAGILTLSFGILIYIISRISYLHKKLDEKI